MKTKVGITTVCERNHPHVRNAWTVRARAMAISSAKALRQEVSWLCALAFVVGDRTSQEGDRWTNGHILDTSGLASVSKA